MKGISMVPFFVFYYMLPLDKILLLALKQKPAQVERALTMKIKTITKNVQFKDSLFTKDMKQVKALKINQVLTISCTQYQYWRLSILDTQTVDLKL